MSVKAHLLTGREPLATGEIPFTGIAFELSGSAKLLVPGPSGVKPRWLGVVGELSARGGDGRRKKELSIVLDGVLESAGIKTFDAPIREVDLLKTWLDRFCRDNLPHCRRGLFGYRTP